MVLVTAFLQVIGLIFVNAKISVIGHQHNLLSPTSESFFVVIIINALIDDVP